MAETAYIESGEKLYLATHGHLFNLSNLPPMGGISGVLYGHTHVPACSENNGFIYMNPGSVSIPKENSRHSYMTLDDGCARWIDISGEVYMERKV